MCGLVGVVSKNANGFTVKERDVFHELLYIDTVRGDDSTGVMLVDRDGNLELAKEASDASYFQKSTEYQSMMTKAFRDGIAMIGHNRKATKGTINDENAHPFVVDDRIVLVHNGTLYGDHKKFADVDVDSHAIAHLIHENGDDVEAALRQLQGAYALIWYDVQNRTMNFVRNAQRPLCFLETTTSWIWASEPGMLGWMAGRHDLGTIGNIELLPAGTLHKFARDGNRWVKSTQALDLTPPATTTTSSYYQPPSHCDMMPTWRQQHHRRVLERRMVSAWEEYDNDTRSDGTDYDDTVLGTTARGVVVVPPKSEEPVVGTRFLAQRPKFNEEESELALKQGCSITVNDFSAAISNIADGEHRAGIPFDYRLRNGKDASMGVFLYAKLEDDPRLMVRCFIAPSDAGQDVEKLALNLAVGDKKLMFTVLARSWHRHLNPELDQTIGCGIIYSKEYGVINPVIQAANESE